MPDHEGRTTPAQNKQSLILLGVLGTQAVFPLRCSLHRTVCTARSASRGESSFCTQVRSSWSSAPEASNVG